MKNVTRRMIDPRRRRVRKSPTGETAGATFAEYLLGRSLIAAFLEALGPAAYGMFVATIGEKVKAAGTRILRKHEAALEYQMNYDTMVKQMKDNGWSTSFKDLGDGKAMMVVKDGDTFTAVVLEPKTGVYSFSNR